MPWQFYRLTPRELYGLLEYRLQRDDEEWDRAAFLAAHTRATVAKQKQQPDKLRPARRAGRAAKEQERAARRKGTDARAELEALKKEFGST